jgi:hypothetical protein
MLELDFLKMCDFELMSTVEELERIGENLVKFRDCVKGQDCSSLFIIRQPKIDFVSESSVLNSKDIAVKSKERVLDILFDSNIIDRCAENYTTDEYTVDTIPSDIGNSYNFDKDMQTDDSVNVNALHQVEIGSRVTDREIVQLRIILGEFIADSPIHIPNELMVDIISNNPVALGISRSTTRYSIRNRKVPRRQKFHLKRNCTRVKICKKRCLCKIKLKSK